MLNNKTSFSLTMKIILLKYIRQLLFGITSAFFTILFSSILLLITKPSLWILKFSVIIWMILILFFLITHLAKKESVLTTILAFSALLLIPYIFIPDSILNGWERFLNIDKKYILVSTRQNNKIHPIDDSPDYDSRTGYSENSEVIFNKQLVRQGVFTDDFYYKNSIENFKKNNEFVDESKVLFLETALFMGYHNDTKSVNVELSKFYFLYLTTIGLSITLFEILLFNSYFIVLVLFFITLRFLYKLL